MVRNPSWRINKTSICEREEKHRSLPETSRQTHKNQLPIMINLNCEPPLTDVAILGSSALRVYLMLFEATKIDIRGNCGGLSCWSIKGLANELSLHVRTVNSAIHKLLDTGYIQIAGEQRNRGNSNNTIWRVTHPKALKSV